MMVWRATIHWSAYIVEFENGEKCTFQGLREQVVVDRLRERGVSNEELDEARTRIDSAAWGT